MRCVKPRVAFRSPQGGITFSRVHSTGLEIRVRCNQCIGCRAHRSREWAVRIVHEAQMHEENCFLTLTYNDENLPEHGTLVKEDYVNFFKRFRERLRKADLKKGITPRRIRHFYCGEYGEENYRPHYHSIIFGYRDADSYLWCTSVSGHPLLRSPALESAWINSRGEPLGHVLVGEVTFDSAQYVAKYTTKKLNVSKESSEEDYRRWEQKYQRVDLDTGEVIEVLPEFAHGSNRPGIGKSWFDKYWKDAFPSDFLVVKGKKVPVPRYYEKLYERRDPEGYNKVKRERIRTRDRKDDGPERLAAIEKVAFSRANFYGGRNQ